MSSNDCKLNTEVSGFFLVDKEKGYTSFDVCNKLKHKFKFKKVGHNGTLDPNASGLLIIAVNKATKQIDTLNCDKKEYIAKIMFGKSSKTFDTDCDIIETFENISITEPEIDKAIYELKDTKTQIPPMFSAVKVNGKKLYELARKGVDIELQPRDIEIYNIERISDIYLVDNFKYVEIKMLVSKGFYVRSFVRDLGAIINKPCILYDLRRTKNGNFRIENAKKIDDINLDDLFF